MMEKFVITSILLISAVILAMSSHPLASAAVENVIPPPNLTQYNPDDYRWIYCPPPPPQLYSPAPIVRTVFPAPQQLDISSATTETAEEKPVETWTGTITAPVTAETSPPEQEPKQETVPPLLDVAVNAIVTVAKVVVDTAVKVANALADAISSLFRWPW